MYISDDQSNTLNTVTKRVLQKMAMENMELVYDSCPQYLRTVKARMHQENEMNKSREYIEKKAGSNHCFEGIIYSLGPHNPVL